MRRLSAAVSNRQPELRERRAQAAPGTVAKALSEASSTIR
jgi:hypothetical protein